MDGMGDMGGMMGGASPAPAHDHAAHDKWVARCRPVLHRSTRNPATRPLKPCHLPCPLAFRYHSSVERLPDGSYRYTHGAWLGHMVPGAFFLVRAMHTKLLF